MFGKPKRSSHEKDEPLPPAPQLQDFDSCKFGGVRFSCIGPGMTVVGKISSEGVLNVLGRVEGELHASIVRISRRRPSGRHHRRTGTNHRRPF